MAKTLNVEEKESKVVHTYTLFNQIITDVIQPRPSITLGKGGLTTYQHLIT
jgi:hypothetical protein